VLKITYIKVLDFTLLKTISFLFNTKHYMKNINFVGQRPMEVSPKPTEINFFVGVELISVGFWLTKVN
jgi:uncharacterized protein YydD (DUF2326 family)